MWQHELAEQAWHVLPYRVAHVPFPQQALVGDKTLAFWMMDKEVRWWTTTNEPFWAAALCRGPPRQRVLQRHLNSTCALLH